MVCTALTPSKKNGSSRRPAKTRRPSSLSALFVVHPEGDGLAGRGGAGAFLRERRATLALDRGREPAANDVLLLADGKRGCGSARDRDRPQPESVVDRIGKQRGSVLRSETRRAPGPERRAVPDWGRRRHP